MICVNAMETVGTPLLVGIDCLGVSDCIYDDKLFLHWIVQHGLFTHMVVVD